MPLLVTQTGRKLMERGEMNNVSDRDTDRQETDVVERCETYYLCVHGHDGDHRIDGKPGNGQT